jgi:hypothetical protein
MSQKLDSKIAVIGIDIGQNSFHIVGQGRRGPCAGSSRRGLQTLAQVTRLSRRPALTALCARRACAPAGRDEGTAARHEQRNSVKQGDFDE